MSIVICRLPAAGLGNQLFPLIKAAVFAELNGMPLHVTGYNRFKIGPWLRREKSKRNYQGYFRFQKNILAGGAGRFSLWRYRGYEEVVEPPVAKLSVLPNPHKKFIFSAIPHWRDYFAGLKEHRDLAISLFRGILTGKIIRISGDLPAPCIGVHIRMGDFRKLAAGEDFASVGAVRTPEDYFVEMISSVRSIHGSPLPVTVFTDGYKKEFKTLFALENVQMAEGNADITDLLLLSRSKLIITSAGSTFSYWSGFLSDVPLIMHPAHLHEAIRPAAVNEGSYEGSLDPDHPHPLLIKQIKEIVTV